MPKLLFCTIVICTISSEIITTGTNRRSPLSVRFLNNISNRLAEWERINSLPTLNTPNRVKSLGYPFEAHEVITKDGYILQLHRIPHNINNTLLLDHETRKVVKRPVVVVSHGIFSSSFGWLILPDNLALFLVDAGYDVWLANSRGTPYANTHTNFTNKDSAFWNFSQHELGIYDLSATIDYILNETEQEKLYHIGFSAASSYHLILMSEQPKYNDKIRLGIFLAPSAYTHDSRPFRALSKLLPILQPLQRLIGPFPIPDESVALISNYGYLHNLCDERLIPSKRIGICWLIRVRLEGFFPNQQNLPALNQYSFISSNFYTSTSSKVVIHIVQGTVSGKFRNYDYGNSKRNNSKLTNMKVYGKSIPPEYDLSKVTSPTYIIYGDGDSIINSANIKLLASKLPNLIELYRLPNRRFGHTDFPTSRNANRLVYQHLLDVMSKY